VADGGARAIRGAEAGEAAEKGDGGDAGPEAVDRDEGYAGRYDGLVLWADDCAGLRVRVCVHESKHVTV
jgi:hypothetical protein